MTAQRYGENFEPIVEPWHFWTLALFVLYANVVAPLLGWWQGRMERTALRFSRPGVREGVS